MSTAMDKDLQQSYNAVGGLVLAGFLVAAAAPVLGIAAGALALAGAGQGLFSKQQDNEKLKNELLKLQVQEAKLRIDQMSQKLDKSAAASKGALDSVSDKQKSLAGAVVFAAHNAGILAKGAGHVAVGVAKGAGWVGGKVAEGIGLKHPAPTPQASQGQNRQPAQNGERDSLGKQAITSLRRHNTSENLSARDKTASSYSQKTGEGKIQQSGKSKTQTGQGGVKSSASPVGAKASEVKNSKSESKVSAAGVAADRIKSAATEGKIKSAESRKSVASATVKANMTAQGAGKSTKAGAANTSKGKGK